MDFRSQARHPVKNYLSTPHRKSNVYTPEAHIRRGGGLTFKDIRGCAAFLGRVFKRKFAQKSLNMGTSFWENTPENEYGSRAAGDTSQTNPNLGSSPPSPPPPIDHVPGKTCKDLANCQLSRIERESHAWHSFSCSHAKHVKSDALRNILPSMWNLTHQGKYNFFFPLSLFL